MTELNYDKKSILNAIIVKFGSQKECAEALGIGESAFSRNLDRMSDKFVARLKSIGVPVFTLNEEIENESGISGSIPLHQYPVLAEVYAGPAELLDSQIVNEYKGFEYRENSNRCFAVKVNGDSMESTLPSGTVALIDMDAAVLEDDIVIVKLNNGKQYIKRYHNVTQELIELSSDNPLYANKLIAKSDIEIIYPVVEYLVKPRRRK